MTPGWVLLFPHCPTKQPTVYCVRQEGKVAQAHPPKVVAAKSHRFLFEVKLGASTKCEVPIVHWMTGFHLAGGLLLNKGRKLLEGDRTRIPATWKPRKNGCVRARAARLASSVTVYTVITSRSPRPYPRGGILGFGLLRQRPLVMRELDALLVMVNAQGPVMRRGRTVRGQRPGRLQLGTNAAAGFRGKTPDMGRRWTRSLGGHRKRTKVGSCCGYGDWRIRGAAATSTGVRDLAYMWSFGPSAVEGSRYTARVAATPVPPSPTDADKIWWRRNGVACFARSLKKAKQLRDPAGLGC
jgi:hypothetical protein